MLNKSKYMEQSRDNTFQIVRIFPSGILNTLLEKNEESND